LRESVVWNLRLSPGQAMQKATLREIEWASPKETPPLLLTIEEPVEEYGPWQWAAAFTLQEDGKLLCPAGASLWLSEVRQENAFTRAGRLSGLPDRLSMLFSDGEQCLASWAKGDRARRISAVRRLLPPLTLVECERKPVLLGPMR
jgi:hypothetical protein